MNRPVIPVLLAALLLVALVPKTASAGLVATTTPTSTIALSYLSLDSPEGYTTEWTYTVPTGEIDVIRFATVCMMRQAVATTLGRTDEGIAFWPYGMGGIQPPAGTAQAAHLESWMMENAVGTWHCQSSMQGITMLPGSALAGSRIDYSVGGQVLFQIEAVIDRYVGSVP